MWRPYHDLRTSEQYGIGLILLLGSYLLSAAEWEGMEDLSGFLFIAVLLVINANDNVPRPIRVTAFTAAGISAVLSLIRAIQPVDATIAVDAFSTMVVVGVTIIAIMSRLLQHAQVTISTVMGAFLAYALVGFAAAFLYIGVDSVTTGDFFREGPVPDADYIYFSMVTLTTVGFGDLTAATEIGQRLVVVEALVGQVFLVVLVARLVSLWKAPDRGITQASE